jgi:hypothetical protein
VAAADEVELARKRRAQAPPPWVIFESLVDPLNAEARSWFDVLPGERTPTILEQVRPHLVVWDSIWTDQPGLRVRFEIEPDGAGSVVTWTLLGQERQFDDEDIRRHRSRLNQLINGHLRDTFDQ